MNIHHITLKTYPDQFDIRSQTSHTNQQQQKCISISSDQNQINDVSHLIDTLIIEQKKKYLPSKSDNLMTRYQNIIKTKRYYSVSNFSPKKTLMQLPQHIKRILNSTKRYPNVFNLQRTQDDLDSIYGAFFGFLIGDIVGSFMAYTARDFQLFIPNALLMNGGGTYNLGPCQGTDQTQILFSLCYGLIQGKGAYNRNLVASKYMQWFQSKPFNYSAVFALSMQELRRMKVAKQKIQPKKVGDILLQSSIRNKNQQSSIGLIRVLPLTIFSLKFSEADFQKLIKDQLSLICPNQLVIQSGLVYGKILRVIILTHDHQRAFYAASKWTYEHGSNRLMELWKVVEKGIEIPSRGNMGKLKTSFTYSCIQINKKDINFIDPLVSTLMKGGDTQTNCSIVMTLIGAIVGYNGIPGYFKQKIVNSRIKNSIRPRDQKYSPNKIIQIIQSLQKNQMKAFNKYL